MMHLKRDTVEDVNKVQSQLHYLTSSELITCRFGGAHNQSNSRTNTWKCNVIIAVMPTIELFWTLKLDNVKH